MSGACRLALGIAAAYLCLCAFTLSLSPAWGQDDEDLRSGFHPFHAPFSNAPAQGTFQEIRRIPKGYALRFGFKNFNRQVLNVSAILDENAVADSIREFGYRKSDFDALDAWYKSAQESANERARRFPMRPDAQEQLDAVLNNLAQEYRRRRVAMVVKAGFRYDSEHVIEPDVPGIAARNVSRVLPLARGFSNIAFQKGYGAEDLVGAVTAMVQTSLRYEVPPMEEGSRVIAGMMPPPQTLVLGQGDCSTKAALMASLLKNWPNLRMVGLALPDHYLVAVYRIPRSGEVYIEHQGLPFVLIETAGPGWLPPGTVGDTTEGFIRSGGQFDIQSL